MREVAHAMARRWMEKDFMSPSAGDRSGPAGSRDLLACFEAARVREEAKVFHECVHDAHKIGMLPANASLRAKQVPPRAGESARGQRLGAPVPSRRSLLRDVMWFSTRAGSGPDRTGPAQASAGVSRHGFLTADPRPFDIGAKVKHEPSIMPSFAAFRRGLHRAGNLIAGN